MSKQIVIRFAGIEDINTIGFLAQQIWPTAYGSIITQEQIRYMLNLFYSPEALSDQILNQQHSFVFAEEEEEPIGFASFSHMPAAQTGDAALTGGANTSIAPGGGNLAPGSQQENEHVFKLHKLYIDPNSQGKGVGKALIDFITEEIKSQVTLSGKNGQSVSLRLGVNRFNPALKFYERVGFNIIREEKTEIGNGFVMDDFIMEKKL